MQIKPIKIIQTNGIHKYHQISNMEPPKKKKKLEKNRKVKKKTCKTRPIHPTPRLDRWIPKRCSSASVVSPAVAALASTVLRDPSRTGPGAVGMAEASLPYATLTSFLGGREGLVGMHTCCCHPCKRRNIIYIFRVGECFFNGRSQVFKMTPNKKRSKRLS